jgi:DNA-binding FadR family transcriptional regulator
MPTLKSSSNSRARDAADHLEEQLLLLKPNDRVGTKEELRLRLGVAAGTINEAIRLLQERRLIEVKPGPGGGIFVLAPDPVVRLGQTLLSVRGQAESVDQAVAVREALEPLTVMRALENRSAEGVATLRTRLALIHGALGDDELFLREIWHLHEEIAGLGDNGILTSVYLGMMRIIAEATASVVPQTKTLQYKRSRYEIHKRLVDAIDAQDHAAAQKALKAHALSLS